MSERLLDSSTITKPTTEPQTEQTLSFVVTFESQVSEAPSWTHPLFPDMTPNTHSDHLHNSRFVSQDLKWCTKVVISPNDYFTALREFIDNTQNEEKSGLFETWDFHKYMVYYMTRTANENRNSVRNNWEAMGKGLHKAEWYAGERDKDPKERTIYQELENDTIYREGM